MRRNAAQPTPLSEPHFASPAPTLPSIPPPLRLPPRPIPPAPHEYLRPNYAHRFRCIASTCEDTCCQGWGVPVDQATYEKYRSNELLKPHLGVLIVLNTGHSSPSDYARIPLTTQSSCPFLDEKHLCGIQTRLGAEMLPSTCATYPRAVTTNTGQREEALNLSCPEAARLTLLDPNLLGLAALPRSGTRRYNSQTRLADRATSRFEPRLAVREFALLLLADRGYPLWQRLYQLGIFTRRLQTASDGRDGRNSSGSVANWSESNPERVAFLLADSGRIAAQNRVRDVIDEIQPHPAEQLQLVAELLRLRIAQPPVPTRFLECVQEFEMGLGLATATTEQQILDAYDTAYLRFYQPLMAHHPHLLENDLANYIFKNSYPFGRQQRNPDPLNPATSNAEAEHLALCVHSALTQTLLIGMAAYHREAFSPDHVVKLVQSLARTFEHSQQALDQITQFVHTQRLNNPRGIALLLRHASA